MDILKLIQQHVVEGRYGLQSHAIRHIVVEGFVEEEIIEAILCAKVLELYPDHFRCLLLGSYRISEKTREWLHIVVDFRPELQEVRRVDIVTAYIPRRPEWKTPRERGRGK